MRIRSGLFLLLLAGLPSLLLADEPTVPHPSLEGVEPLLAEQIVEARELIQSRSEDSEIQQAETWGELGMLYQALEFDDAALAAHRQARRLAPLDGRWPYLIGILLAKDGQGEAALDQFMVARALMPGQAVGAWTRAARVLLELGQNEPARQASEQALALNPDDAAALAVHGEALLALGQAETAIASLTRALTIEPRADRLHYPLAMAHRALGDSEAMQRELERVGRIGVVPDDPVGEFLAAHARGSRIHSLRGREAFQAGDYPAALALFERASQFAPDDPGLWTNLGATQAALGRNAAAITSLQRALELEPENDTARINLAEIHLSEGDQRAAHELLARRGDRLQSSDGRLLRARLGRALGQLDAAATDYLAWLDDRKDLQVWSEAVDVLLRIGRHAEVLELATHPGLNEAGRSTVADLGAELLDRDDASLADLGLASSLAEHLMAVDPSAAHARLRVASLQATRPDCRDAISFLQATLAGDALAPDDRLELQRLVLQLAREPACRDRGSESTIP
ncbi:tetratricopeptide repeat protein [Wenzhouxiangella marina]|uniref:Uncharacterized protein n=1 Tax=Wenzhouxiangella marina TaxID=1579979 RepID=A0A0K0Y037_9GAMM|nr:tetratricopeptide repeat protein [Wenzhouxiangella marina]AKS43308.1 hypothetical protein WM2015_2954 [Wenzhouxiangella marina]MBB6087001.1 tetratricopeptide (TPR) repeat protein [Wenzhouxiangella marina]